MSHKVALRYLRIDEIRQKRLDMKNLSDHRQDETL
ncbi:Uncharacterised protein [uncultured archaeon]|nr:Uncharacterised protein [uncultured archaeon]